MKRLFLSTCLLVGMFSGSQAYSGDGSAIGDKRPPRKNEKQDRDKDRIEWPDILDIFKRG
ncbi:MAG: hypothetical protein ACOH5I_18645 [Oligoflexus sp.]